MSRHVLVQHNTLFRSKYFMLQLLKDNDLATCLFIYVARAVHIFTVDTSTKKCT